MLDVHVLTLPGTPAAWVEQRRASIAVAAHEAGFPVTVSEVRGIRGHIGQARVAAFALGTHPFVTYVDDDDYLMPNAFACLRSALEADPAAIFTGELVDTAGRLKPRHARHNMTVVRRSIAEAADLTDYRVAPEVRLRRLACQDESQVIDVSECVYVYRNHFSEAKKMIMSDLTAAGAEWKRAHG